MEAIGNLDFLKSSVRYKILAVCAKIVVILWLLPRRSAILVCSSLSSVQHALQFVAFRFCCQLLAFDATHSESHTGVGELL